MQKIVAKVVLIGSIGVGKTSLIRRFVHSKFSDQYLSTIGVKVDKKTISMDDAEIDLLIWDLAGEIYLNNLFDKYLHGASAVIGVFDLTRPDTHDKLLEVFDEISESNRNIQKVIVGNKSDLAHSDEYNKHVRQNYTYDFLTSAKTGAFVEDSFRSIAHKIALPT